jgi:hypothetical protein
LAGAHVCRHLSALAEKERPQKFAGHTISLTVLARLAP